MNLDAPSSSSLGLLTLLGLRGIGPQSADRLACSFTTLREIQEASPIQLETKVSAPARAALGDWSAWVKAFDQAHETLEEADRRHVDVISATDESYPEWLRGIPDRPPVLFIKGTLHRDRRSVACIGTREPSRFGEDVTPRIVAALAERSWSIVSGLALGVDSLAHRAALDSRAHTVAVLGNGLESVYPRSNERLASEILAGGGALLSEQPFGAPPIPRHFIQRDRIQSGMSAGTVVMQTDLVGGSMHTVRFTLGQRRLLFAPVPTGLHAKEAKSRGILALTQMSGRDLARALGAEGEYAALLNVSYGDRSVAKGISGRDEYGVLLTMLESALQIVQPIDEPGDPQLGLF